jgi:hypothetical protein
LRNYIAQLFLFFATLGCTQLGCSQSAPTLNVGGEEGGKVVSVIEELNEAKGDDKKMAGSFVSKDVAPKSKELNLYAFYVTGTPKIEGESAKCNVAVEKNDGTPVGDFEWELEKKGDTWKIKKAPLK